MFCGVEGWSLLGDAISHSVLPGVVLSFVFNVNYFYGDAVFGILTAMGISWIEHNSRVKSDSAIGIMFSSFLALGVIMLSRISTATDLTSIMFGNILTVQHDDRIITYTISAIVLVILLVFFKEFLITTFDPTFAQAYGLNVKFYDYLLMLLLTLVTVATLKAVGVILVVALLITPASTAYLLTDKFRNMILLSVFFGVTSSVIGMYLSFKYNFPSGGVIVIVASIFFFLAFLFAPKNGLLTKKMRHAK